MWYFFHFSVRSSKLINNTFYITYVLFCSRNYIILFFPLGLHFITLFLMKSSVDVFDYIAIDWHFFVKNVSPDTEYSYLIQLTGGKEARILHVCNSRTYIHANRNSVLSSEGGGRAAAAKRKGCTERGERWQRRTVVFHSHYRNVLPCALVAPRNKSSVTVTVVVGGARGE